MVRILSSVSALLILVAFASPRMTAHDVDKPQEGKVVKVKDGKLTVAVTVKDEKKEFTHELVKDAKITLDDKEVKLEDLKEGYQVKVWMNEKHVFTKIEANSKKK